jgi:hypothetical protein
MKVMGGTADADRPNSGHSADGVETAANISGRVMTVGKAVLVAVIMLIVLGELFATGIVANPGQDAEPTDRVTNETHLGVGAGATVQMNVSANHYYDDGDHAEVVYNETSGAQLTEGTDYEFYTNGTLKNLDSSATDFNVTYSYYQQNAFQAMTSTFGDYGVVAFTMIGLGLIAAGAAAALSYFRFGGGAR